MDDDHPFLALILLALLGGSVYALAKRGGNCVSTSKLDGVNTHLFKGDNVAALVAKARCGGISWLRDDIFSWVDLMPTPTAIDWSRPDAFFAATAGLQTLGILGTAPTWANGVSDADYKCGDPPHWWYMPTTDAMIGAYAYFCAQLADRYKQVLAWEIWNEPNLYAFNPPVPDAARYTRMLQAGYTGVKAGNPNALVVGGALSDQPTQQLVINAPCGTFTETDIAADEFLRSMYGAGAKGFFDVLSLHVYGDPAIIDRVRQVMIENGDDKPIWITEFGYQTCPAGPSCVTYAEQATQTLAAISAFRSRPFVQRLFYYMLNDNDNCADPFCFSGLVQSQSKGYKEKPVYYAIR